MKNSAVILAFIIGTPSIASAEDGATLKCETQISNIHYTDGGHTLITIQRAGIFEEHGQVPKFANLWKIMGIILSLSARLKEKDEIQFGHS